MKMKLFFYAQTIYLNLYLIIDKNDKDMKILIFKVELKAVLWILF